ncbi:hypothetical protein SMC26_22730 [Actinomadura fulvescens]|uniref:hypothetical protein n=1 Tax=Actinomadura fulvescens TaxID=46160 RepID=UPI0031E1D4A9
MAVASLAMAASAAVMPAASADSPARSAPVSASVSSDQASIQAGAQKWSKWFRLNKVPRLKKAKCRTYASVNSGSKIKFRAYVECTRSTTITVYVTGTRSGKIQGGKSKVCGRNWCDVVLYKPNRKGKQKWCAVAAMPAVGGQFHPTTDRYTPPKACITY